MFLPVTPPANHTVGVGTCCLITIVWTIIFGTIGLSLLMRGLSNRRASSYASRHKHCDSIACRSYAEMLSSSLSKTYNPCGNFYRFVCKGYANSSRSVFANHKRDFVARVARTLAIVVVPTTGQSAFEKAARYYQSCVAALVESGHGQFLEFRRIMRDAGVVWPSMPEKPDFLSSVAEMIVVLNVQTILHMESSDVDKTYTINVKKSGWLLGLRNRRRIIENGAKYSDYYNSFRALYASYDANATEPVDFELFLETENCVFSRLLRDRSERGMMYGSAEMLLNVTPTISPHRWSEAFRRVRMHPSDTPLRVRVHDVAFLRAVSDLVEEIGEWRLHFYVDWAVVQYLAPFMSKSLATIFDGRERIATERTPLRCLYRTEEVMGLTMYAKYVVDEFDEGTRKDLDVLINVIFVSMMRSMREASLKFRGLNIADVRQFASILMSDVNLLRDRTRFDSFFSDFDDMTSSFVDNWRRSERARRVMSPKSRLQIRSSFINTIAVSTNHSSAEEHHAALRLYTSMLPLFDRQALKSVNYGGLGSFIAVAMFRYYFNRSLPSGSELHGTQKAKNLARCYSRLGPEPTETLAYERALTINFLWKAFLLGPSHRPVEKPLPGLEMYTDKQLFFMASCYPFCTGRLSREAEDSCNEPLRNSRYFPEVFRCRDTSYMNPRLKCSTLY
ncbi:hypothetical protein HPB47_002177 [Ixodes persulcatus]|uniref:Uncharacterized protein n=1 Tax=Ixodes persulcatus TaxID=34615 RepID=A0AC60PLY2_IXOPE|nr:hypothetical protein HPB47_002177 [Ixodes persulcatus]